MIISTFNDYYTRLCYTPSTFIRPQPSDFKVEIISNHKDTDGKAIRQYSIDGIKTIGVVENEPFQVHFTNNSNEDVSVRVTLDGTCVLSGKPADLNPDTLKWFVRRGSTLHLRAWHENSSGGAKLVFTNEDKSVALHTSGDTSQKGIIAFAVFMEEKAPAQSYNPYSSEYYDNIHTNSASKNSLSKRRDRISEISDYRYDYSAGMNLGEDNVKVGAAASSAAGASVNTEGAIFSMDLDRERSVEDGSTRKKKMSKSAAVGAGEYTEQKTHTVKGLDKPTLNSIIRMRYLFWDELETKLAAQKERTEQDRFPSGFPAETPKKFADLTNVPRVVSEAADKKPDFSRTV